MKKFLLAVAAAVVLSGCAGPKIMGTAMDASIAPQQREVVVVRHSPTRPGFLLAMEDWLRQNDYRYRVVDEHSRHDQNSVTLEYVGHWGWDLALYLREARIEAFHGGQRVGRVDYLAPNTLNGNKFGSGSERVMTMLDTLFGRITPEQATARINGEH